MPYNLRDAVRYVSSSRPIKCPKCKCKDVNIRVNASKDWVGYCEKCKAVLTEKSKDPLEVAHQLVERCKS